MTHRHVSLRGNAIWLVMVDAFFAIAEAGGSIQARLARAELKKLTEAQKAEISNDSSLIQFNRVVNTALMNAMSVCNENRRKEPAEKDMGYGSDVIIRHHPTVYAHERLLTYGGSVLQFLWLAHNRFDRSNESRRDQYVDVWFGRADSEIEINGIAADVIELFNRSKVSEIIPKWTIFDPNKGFWWINMDQIAKGQIVRMPRKKRAA